MTTVACVFTYADVPPSHRDDYEAGYNDTFSWARHAGQDEIDDEAHMARERLASDATTKTAFWYLHGVLTAIARATDRCPHCQRTTGPCDAAGKVA